MSVNIHGKQYITVAERVQQAHTDLTGKEKLSILTEVLFQSPVVVKATVTTRKGTFTGISAANPSKTIEKMSPYEVAETSAVGRALGFAGYGIIEGIATADEVVKATEPVEEVQKQTVSADDFEDKHICPEHKIQMKERLTTVGGKYYDHRQEVNGQWQRCYGKGWKSQ